MKMNIIRLSTLMILIAVMIAVSGCGKSNTSESAGTENTTQLITTVTNEKFNELSGTWDIDKYTSYYFGNDGTGKLILTASEYDFKYTVENNILSIDFEKDSVDDSVYEYKVNGNNLTLKSKDINKGTYELVKRS